MQFKKWIMPAILFSGVALTSSCSHVDTSHSKGSHSPRNIILIIGDGMDDQQITIARNYLKGSRGKLILDSMAVRSAVQVLTVSNENPEQAVYVADSANSASAMASGIVTSRGRIATTASTDCDASTIIELAERANLRTGIVTTASVTDATPASFVAHVSSRNCENPTMMVKAKLFGDVVVDCSSDLKAQSGLGSISEQIADSAVDVVLGGGMKHFKPNVEGGSTSVRQLASDNGFYVIDTLANVGKIPSESRLLGLFSASTMPVQLRGESGRTAEKLVPNSEGVIFPKPMVCEDNPKYEDTPSLKKMMGIALAHLSRDNDKGFFLVVESASIDKQSHRRNTCGHIGELAQLEETLGSALEFAELNPGTLVLVTADHGQAAQIIPNKSLYSAYGKPVFTLGYLARIKTLEGSVMAINYATNNFSREEHSGVNVPLFANKVGLGLVPTMLLQSQLFTLMRDYLNLKSEEPKKCTARK